MASYLPAATKNTMISAAFTPGTIYYWGFAETNPLSEPSSEVTGTATHKRQGSSVSTPSTGVEHTTSAMTWTNMVACTIQDFCINVAATGTGTYKGGGPNTSVLTIPAGSTIAAAIGAFTLSQGG